TCHKSTTTFSGARFSHTGTMAACASCHNGMAATGKPPKHVATSAPCETCHKSTTTFSGARFSHTGTMAACASCHNGMAATGKPQKHVATSAPCESCHKNTVSFSGARMDHTSLTAPCASCHNGSNATGKSPKHFVTNVPCESCHRTVSWSSVNYRHMSASYPNHSAAIGCTACHSGNSQAVVFKFAAYKPDCAACHANDFRPQQHAKLVKPAPMDYTVAELKDCTGACHIYADKSQTTIITRRQRQHRVNGGGW
ncbi:cytochrome c3 family protein, partial [Bradyrhizobium sp. HKCCYLRH1062]|uniref:cytochrome c3 family protein n=2 Tax=Bradyrhizobium TaxID=374 RepID=UPI003EB777D3